MCFQPGEGLSRCLLRDCEILANLRLAFVSSSTLYTSQLQPALDFSRHHRELGWRIIGEVDKGIWTFINCTCHSANYIGFKPAEYNYPNAAAVANNINFILHWNPLKLLFEMLHNFHFWKISNKQLCTQNYSNIHLLWPSLEFYYENYLHYIIIHNTEITLSYIVY